MLHTNKYYTPSIEEFCVGFEYEIYDTKWSYEIQHLTGDQYKVLSEPTPVTDWYKEIYDLNKYVYLKDSVECYNDLAEFISDNEIRVKYLSIEDVESLGFENSLDEPGEWFWSFKGNGDIQLYYDDKITDDTKGVGISIYNDNLVFSGYVKNKSELVKLLKQLDIC